jgi:hypothetical protein
MLPINTLNKQSKYTLEHSTSLSISVGDDGDEPALVDDEDEAEGEVQAAASQED